MASTKYWNTCWGRLQNTLVSYRLIISTSNWNASVCNVSSVTGGQSPPCLCVLTPGILSSGTTMKNISFQHHRHIILIRQTRHIIAQWMSCKFIKIKRHTIAVWRGKKSILAPIFVASKGCGLSSWHLASPSPCAPWLSLPCTPPTHLPGTYPPPPSCSHYWAAAT